MTRRTLALAILLGLLAAPLAVKAQQAGKVWRIGVMMTTPRRVPETQDRFNAFLQESRDLGYREGQNVVIESRHTDGLQERYPTGRGRAPGVEAGCCGCRKRWHGHRPA
jgi:hypothetical protein